MLTDRPELQDTSPLAARRWFSRIAAQIGGEGWHPDDPPGEIINVASGERVFSDDEAVYVARVMADIRDASAAWPDPDFLYTVAAQTDFAAEEMWPGFVVDAGVVGCIGTGYASVPSETPNFLLEDGGVVFIVEFPGRRQPVSAYGEIHVTPLEGVTLTRGGFDIADAHPERSSTVVVGSLDEIADATVSIFKGASMR